MDEAVIDLGFWSVLVLIGVLYFISAFAVGKLLKKRREDLDDEWIFYCEHGVDFRERACLKCASEGRRR